MAWNAPSTVVATSVVTAALFNRDVRDNLNQCPTAKATTPGATFGVTGLNTVVERISQSAFVDTEESTTSTAYVNLTTVGPSVTVDHGKFVLVYLYAQLKNATINVSTWMGFDASGSYVLSPSGDNQTLQFQPIQANGFGRFGAAFLIDTGLTSGTTTFLTKYRVTSGTGLFALRKIAVYPL